MSCDYSDYSDPHSDYTVMWQPSLTRSLSTPWDPCDDQGAAPAPERQIGCFNQDPGIEILKAKESQNAHETSGNVRKPELYTFCLLFALAFRAFDPTLGPCRD